MTGTLIVNAKIVTLDERLPSASAIAIEDGHIRAVGESENLKREFDGRLPVEDMQGKILLPGLIDAHLHLQSYALSLEKIDCETITLSECLQRVAKRAETTPPGEWIHGHGWNQNAWEDGAPTVDDLDKVAPNNPVYLTHKSLHSAWANHAALTLAGLSQASPDPDGGRLGRSSSVKLDGLLYESAMDLVEDIIPQPSGEKVTQAIQRAISELWKMGLTGVHDFDRRECFSALQTLHAQGGLKLRVVKSIPLEDLSHAAGVGLHSGFGDDMLRIGSVKAFMDGALGPQTAAMLTGYESDPENRGILMMDSEQLFEHARLAADSGLSMAVHAIGDRANHEVLNAYQQLRDYESKMTTPKRLRHRIEHVQVLHPEDLSRLSSLGIIASMQPIHATSDMLMAERYWGERSALAYAWREQLQQGATLAFGSDAPVESPNPFLGLHAAVTRRRSDGTPGPDGWRPEGRLTFLEAIHGFTSGAAYAAGMESRQGKLKPGYLADLIVLEDDPFDIDPHAIQFLQPARTMVDGEWVFVKS